MLFYSRWKASNGVFWSRDGTEESTTKTPQNKKKKKKKKKKRKEKEKPIFIVA